jgi:hypothetical protein
MIDERQEEYDAMEGQRMRSDAQVIYNRSLTYDGFLKSLYWQYVRRKLFAGRFTLRRKPVVCERCGSREAVDIHHKTYENQGDELNHMGDLVVLCRPCHEGAHAVPIAWVQKKLTVTELFMGELGRRSSITPPSVSSLQPITQADIDETLRKLKDSKA